MYMRTVFNRSQNPIFCVDAQNKQFIIDPATDGETMPGYSCIEVRACSSRYDYNINCYMIPSPHYPSFLSDIGAVAFCSETERQEAIIKYHGGASLVAGFYANLISLSEGVYRVIINLSDKDYYSIINGSIQKIPIADHLFRQRFIESRNITANHFETRDLLITAVMLRETNTKRTFDIDSYQEQWVPKDINTKEPIICATNGLFLFNSREAAEFFIKKYGDIADYFIEKSRDHVQHLHEREVQDLNRQFKIEKEIMFRNSLLLAGTTITGVLAERIIVMIGEKTTKVATSPPAEKTVEKVKNGKKKYDMNLFNFDTTAAFF